MKAKVRDPKTFKGQDKWFYRVLREGGISLAVAAIVMAVFSKIGIGLMILMIIIGAGMLFSGWIVPSSEAEKAKYNGHQMRCKKYGKLE